MNRFMNRDFLDVALLLRAAQLRTQAQGLALGRYQLGGLLIDLVRLCRLHLLIQTVSGCPEPLGNTRPMQRMAAAA